MRCSRCGSDVPTTSRFCSTCGFDLAATTPVRAIATGEITDFDMVREALASEYEIVEELGRGGMAQVYRARDLQLEREVAIKVLPFTFAFDADFVERFQREARTSAQLEHPNIIPIYRVGQAGRVIYFVMKYLRGGSLSSILTERRRIAPAEIRRVLVEAGAALGYAAQRGVVHRDIKPDNIMFDEFGQSVLTDFGIAKAASGQRLTSTGMSIGTPHYMSPEQARAQNTDGRSDIYSLGVVAYQCLAGHVPYDGEDNFSIGYKHITEPLPTPTLTSADERRLFEVIRRMLAKEPAERFQTCEQLVAVVQEDNVAPPGSLRLRGSAPPVAQLPVSPSPRPALAPTTPVAALRAPSPASGPHAPAAPAPVAAAAAAAAPTPAPVTAPSVARPTPTRRVAHRSPVMQRSERPAWPWLLAILALVGAGAAYVYLGDTVSDGTGRVAASRDSVQSRDTTPLAGALAAAAADSGPAPASTRTAPGASAAVDSAPARAVSAPTRDSGAIRLRGIPAGSTVQIDQRVPSGAVTPLSVGRHEVAVSAPLHEFYVDTVTVAAGDTLDLAPALMPLGAGVRDRRARARDAIAPLAARGPCEPGPAYNAGECFDERPQPTDPPFVAVPEGTAEPERGTALWVRVSRTGQTVSVRPLRSSRSLAFDRAAAAFVRGLTWEPARKGGTAVESWTQLEVRPTP